jgi:hypothetical protein
MELLLEPELVAVERDRLVDVVDEIADGRGLCDELLAARNPSPQRLRERRTRLDRDAREPQRVEWIGGNAASSR